MNIIDPWSMARRAFAVLFASFMLAPLLVILIMSFTNEGYNRFPPPSYGIRWYIAAFETPAFQQGFLFSLKVAVITCAISGLIGISAAIGIGRSESRWVRSMATYVSLPLTVPNIIIAIMLLQTFSRLSIASSPYGLITGHVLVTTPYVLRMTMTSLETLGRQTELASYSLGASWFYTLRRVVLPQIAPGMVGGLLFAFLLSFDEVTISIFLSLPGATTLPSEIFGYASQGDDPLVTAISGFMILFAALFVLVVEKLFGVLRLIANEK
ncbi:ABC transporter permease [Paracoccus onubensis]|uniref:ABC transporter permease n=1 Tax=Paracoccus onubensis TaxID=1675788 RepID=UPI0027321444|nr:ABC transporter permease [Paracoccus onubensis]MDP0930304.1 ABC transporter permease [Paracoccus onubensis]